MTKVLVVDDSDVLRRISVFNLESGSLDSPPKTGRRGPTTLARRVHFITPFAPSVVAFFLKETELYGKFTDISVSMHFITCMDKKLFLIPTHNVIRKNEQVLYWYVKMKTA